MLRILLAVAGVVGTWFLLRRRKINYPDAKTLIIQHEQDLSRRVLKIDGVANFRDLGGYATADGQRVRYGQVFRSGKLDGLTDAGRQAAQALGIRLICDMRSPEEVADAPDAMIDATTRSEAFPLQTDDNRIAQVSALLFNRAAVRDLLPQLYTRVILDENAQTLGQIIERVADANNRPTLIHCTAGKDRTGVISALLLEILGVPDDVIIADYTLSNLYYDTSDVK